MLASEPLLSNRTGRAEQISPDPIMLKRYTDGLNHFQCKENIKWHILTSMWIIIVYLLRYFSTFSYSCWITRLRLIRRRLFFPAQEFAAFRACIRPVVRPANQRAPWRTALAPKTASSAYNGMRTRHTAAKPTDFAECFWYFEKALFNYTFIKKTHIFI